MVRSAILRGLTAFPVEVEIALSRGNGLLRIVGLPRKAVKESEERLRLAISATGYEWPRGNVTVNLAPADVPKESSSIDLALALAILEASGQEPSALGDEVFAVGELGLDGRVKACQGVLSMGRALPDGSVLVAPRGNEYELALLRYIKHARKNFEPMVVRSLAEAGAVFAGKEQRPAKARNEDFRPAFGRGVDFADVKGQAQAKRALEVAAAGGHNVLLIGPPGEGKSLLAKALPTVLPRLSQQEILELTEIYSARGELPSGNHVVLHRPFRPVHHTASTVAIAGGGSGFPSPGEITLAHRGVLFMDEFPEFKRSLLETLRQPLEDGRIHLTRKDGSATYPSEFILVAAMNPCPCGFDGEGICAQCESKMPYGTKTCPNCGAAQRRERCGCTPSQIQAYRKRLSGPILDRIDLRVRVSPLMGDERFSSSGGEPSARIRKRVEEARRLQAERFDGTPIHTNANIPGGSVDKYCKLHPSALAAMREVANRLPELSTRGHDKLLKVARTIGDLNGSSLIYKKHVVEGAELSGHEKVRDFLSQLDVGTCESCGASVEPRHKYCPSCGQPLRSESDGPE